LQPEGYGTLLYVLYEVLSGTPIAAVQMEHATTEKLGMVQFELNSTFTK